MKAEGLQGVQDRISRAARRAGRKADDITLVAVTKTVPFESVLPYLKAGIRHLAENRVQEAEKKFTHAGVKSVETDPQLHLIGHLQSNKTKKAVQIFDVIQSVDSAEIAEDLQRHAKLIQKKLPCLIQVKISSEDAKTGLPLEDLDPLMERARAWDHLRFDGVMGIPPFSENPEDARPYFAKLRTISERYGFQTISMGMSRDFEVAIEEGSTMVRLGTILFGERS